MSTNDKNQLRKNQQDGPGLELELYPDGWPIDTRALYPLSLERYGEAYLEQAGRSVLQNGQRIAQSECCFCMYCGYRFDPQRDPPARMREPSGATTGLCPLCQLDMLLCSVDGYPLTDPVFIAGLAEYCFNGYCPVADGKPIKPIVWKTIEVD